MHWIGSEEPSGNSVVDSYVHQIQELVPGSLWRHVPSAENPADVASRGASLEQLLDRSCWISGPGWLSRPSAMWPSTERALEPPASPPVAAQCLQVSADDRTERSHI
uniref:Uncharacterized protein n=1 Tax=Trichogramma kaykai TaxID=54128 RepID=A0ABD2W9G2_9HYME